jgi:hypothetical protein
MKCHKNEQRASYLGFAETPGKGSEAGMHMAE